MATYLMRSARKPRGRGHERRDEILSAAELLIERRGLDAPLRDIAAAAGVSQASLFKHFATRADLIAALRDKVHAGLEENISAVAVTSGDVRQNLDVILRAHTRLARERPSIFSLAFPSPTQLAQIDVHAADARAGSLPGMARLRAAFSAGGLPAQRPPMDGMSLTSWFLIYGMALTAAIEIGRDRLKGEEMISGFLDLLVRQLSILA